MTVRLLLTTKGTFVPVVRSDLRPQDVVDQLQDDEAGALVVTDDNENMLGIITESDLARGLKRHGRDVVDLPLRDLMTRDVLSVDIGVPITTVLELMHKHKIHYVPVTENKSLAGLITMLDLVKYRLAELELESQALKAYVAGSA